MDVVDRYTGQIKALLPRGRAWVCDYGSNLHKFLQGLSVEPARIQQRAEDLLAEMDPDTATELLAQWEKTWGLPDTCTGQLTTLQERRAALVARITSVGEQSPGFFIRLAQSLGYTITIAEFTQFKAGNGAAGDPVCGDDWVFTWQVNAPQTTIREFRAGQSAAGEPLRSWGNELLECSIEQVKPAHTYVIFTYGG